MKLAVLYIFISALAFAGPKEDAAAIKQLQAQHAADQILIDNLTAQNAQLSGSGTKTGRAITKLAAAGADQSALSTKQSVAVIASVESHAAGAQAAAEDTQETAARIENKVDAISPMMSVPVWLAAIAGMVSVIGVAGSVMLAFINKSKLAEIHILTNSNLAKITGDLQVANEKIAGLRELVSYTSKDAPAPSNKTA
jgi:hypothetical protein